MANVLREGCKWILTVDGRREEFLTEESLDTYIQQQIKEGTIDLKDGALKITPSLDINLQQRTIDVLEDIKSEISDISVLETYENPEFEDAVSFYKIKDSIGVTRFLTLCPKPDGSGEPFVKPFNLLAWRSYTLQRLLADGVEESKAKELIVQMEKTWPTLSDIGTEVHKVFEQVFNNEIVTRNPNSKIGKDEALFNRIVNSVRDFKQSLIDKYEGAKFYTEFGIMTKDVTPEIKTWLNDHGGLDSINGKIDLLVVDKYGNVHVYDFKVSRKSVGDWNNRSADLRKLNEEWDIGKMDAASYQLAFYAAMLKQRGIAVRDVNVVPVKLALSYEDSDNKVNVKNIEDITIDKTIDHVPNVLSGKFAIPTNMSIKPLVNTTNEDILKILDIFNYWFPKNNTLQTSQNREANIASYMDNPKYVVELKPNEHKNAKYKLIQWGLPLHPTVWCKDEDDLKVKLGEYIDKLANLRYDYCNELGHKIQDIFDGNATRDILYEGLEIDKKAWFDTRFKRYFEEGWSFDSNEDMFSNGIFVFSLGNRSEVIIIESQNLNARLNIGLGDFVIGKTTRNRNVDSKKVLQSDNGNLALMEAMIYIGQNQNYFKNKPVSQVSVINPFENQEKLHANSKLLYNYNLLCDKNPDKDVPKLSQGLFYSDIDGLVYTAESILKGEGETILGLVEANKVESDKEKISLLEEALKNAHPILHKYYDLDTANFSDPIWQAYYYLTQARLSLTGEFTSQEVQDGPWFSKGFKLNGYEVGSLQYSPSTDLREFGTLLQNYENEVARKVYQIGWNTEKAFIKLYEEEGNGTSVFDSWFVRNLDGSLHPNLLLKNPDSREFKGSTASREALRSFLETMAKLRWPNATDAELEEKKSIEYGPYYEVPLTEAISTRQLKGYVRDEGLINGVLKSIRQQWKQAATLTKNVFWDEESNAIAYNRSGKQLYNKFELIGSNRTRKIEDHGIAYFETNMEVVFNQALVAFVRTEVAKDYIPRIQAMRLGLKYAQQHGGVNNENIRTAFDRAIRSKFYGENIIEDDTLRELYKFLSFVRSIFTTMTLSINIPSFLRESLQGIYTGVSRSFVQLMPGIDKKTYTDGLMYVIQEAHKNISSVSLLQQLNAQYQMANQSVNQIANQRRINWLNINNWSRDTLFITATAPDFMHRVSILVAKMIGDGCWEAHSLDKDGKLVYNFKKDNRFKHYINNEINHKDYLKEKSLYEKMIFDFNQAGFTNENGKPLQIGDDLPQAYTNIEAQSIKNYADLLYGHYDDSSRALINDTFLGSFFLQYKTYITSKFEQWIMPEGTYNTELLKQQFDPITGEELYQVISEDEEGKIVRDIVRKSQLTQEQIDNDNARIYYDYEGIPMEGLFQEMLQFTRTITSWNFDEFKRMWNDPIDRAYFLLGLHDQFLMAFMMFLVTFVFGKGLDAKHPLNPTEVGRLVRNAGPIEQIAFNVIQGSTVDAQFYGLGAGNSGILQSMAADPPFLTAISRFATTNMKMITGKQSFAYTASQNIGAIRTFQGLLKNLNEE